MSLKARFQNGAWRLIVAQIIFGLRSRCARFLPALRSKRKRSTPAISNPGLARLKWRLRHGLALSTCAAIGFVVVDLARVGRIALAHARLP